ncbi:nucleotide 5'-monophosphate nucleosidase PpnN [Pseudoalteromonas sp. Cnat2-41]|uniref:nucleotide 5'-monophosphate nucleosidase PpnN n=1 Tax=unclassified Pseudoalteromonas TaxID=194690 RepID=UPI001EF7F677|nr:MULTISPECIES: nucleotide 5'-monophosphate nucleosidase PpnN [unclassified Pseudoalteromonas]MCF2860670.1 nucleotide 5'-monophosphate nucleosidase PpnN [Pseudoalteromonas sp. CNAT2-18]MCG7556539.1 nucleotide 5'-monophosphate nucleosidase PpnN [Pseudoalteromonas sp. CNAT2-18.1]MCG7565619.1 nucleotide 5'-monophosphate nucleosidase PpnN [Pseudoalteromonas sp. CnMc7-15]
MQVQLNPTGVLNLLSQLEVDLLAQSTTDRYRLFRNCALAVLNVGSHTDSSAEIYDRFQDFDIRLVARERGIKIELTNPPETAFVDGDIIRGIHEHIFSVIRDILFICQKHQAMVEPDPKAITHMVFDMLRNADAMPVNTDPNMIVCWGGHSINEVEYKYTKEVGYQLGLRGLNICTGCGPGAMKGPMKGATIGHAKQRVDNPRYLGLTEPSIIAAEPPNPIVNELVILPDIEKRLEAFVRVAHGIIIFPGGAGTAEELLYLLGILLHPENQKQQLPVILTGPAQSKDYFDEIVSFVRDTLGEQALDKFEVIIDDPALVASKLKAQMQDVRDYRRQQGDAYYFNWTLRIEPEFQAPFAPTHENMASLNLHLEQPKQQLAANLRRAFSGIVAGNVKDEGIRAIKQHGVFELSGDPELMRKMDTLLSAFVAQGRMKLPGSTYIPCYTIKT